MLIPVHDEIIAEVPMRYWDEGGQLLSKMMIDAANFLPFDSKCDVTTTLRWYGLDYPCKYPKPQSLENMSDDEVKWVQYHLHECEYELPVYKDEDGSKPMGDAAFGINGVQSEELTSYINNYISDNRLTRNEFLDHIEKRVTYGIQY